MQINNPAGGLFAPSGGVFYNGGTQDVQGDDLQILGGTAASVEHRLSTNNDGSVRYNGSASDNISYTGLEPVTDTVVAGNRTITFLGAAETITLTDSGGADGMSTIDSTLGESVTFANPSASLTIDTTATAGADAVNFSALDAAFNANFTVTAKSSDTVDFNSATVGIGAGNASISSGTIRFSGGLLSTTGNVLLTATGAVTTTTAATDVTAASLNASAATGIDLDTNVTNLTASNSGAGNLNLDEANGANVLNVSAAAGNATVTSATGNLVVTTMSASGTATLTATTGSVLDDNNDSTRITAAAVALTAAVDLGAPLSGPQVEDLDTDTASITATTTGSPNPGTHGIWIDELNAVTLASVSTADGLIRITAGGTITATSVTANGAGRNTTLIAATGDIQAGTVSSSGGNVTLTATTGSVLDDGSQATAVSGNNVTVTAGNGTIGTAAANGDLDVAASTGLTTNSSAANGNQFLRATAPTSVSILNAGTGQLTPTVQGHITLTGGSFNLNNGNAVADASALVVNAPAVATLNAAGETVGSLAGTGAVVFGAASLTEGSNNLSTTFSGTLGNPGDSGGLNKIGTGSWTLAAAGTYNFLGAVSVTGGELIVNGTFAASANAVTVSGAGTLGGTGTLNRLLNANSGGTVSPGSPTSSPGKLNTGTGGDTTFNAGATFFVNVGGAGGAGDAGIGYDQLNVTGSVSLGNATLAGTSAGSPFGGQYLIINNDGADPVVGIFSGLPEASFVTLGGVSYQITYVGGTGNDVVLTRVGRFDFNGSPVITAAGYTSVPNTTVYNGTTQTFGWQGSAASGFVRSLPNDLLRDGNWGTDKTFNVDVVNGLYQVTVTAGDYGSIRDNVEVSAEGGTVVAPLINTDRNQFAVRTLLVTVSDGTLNLRLHDLGGTDPYFVINALDIRPANPGSSSVGNLALTGPANIFGDGQTTAAFSAPTGLPNGTLVTVATSVGTIAMADADPIYQGTQVVVSGGLVSFVVRSSAGAGTATITADEVSGLAHGQTTLQIITNDPTKEIKVDFNAVASPTQPGFLGVEPSYTFTSARESGWLSAPGAFNRSVVTADPNYALLRDGHYGSDNTFQINLDAGTYTFTVRMGDYTASRDNMQVFLDGALQFPDIDTTVGTFFLGSFSATLAAGPHTIRCFDNGGADPFFVVNSLQVQAGGPQLAQAGTFAPTAPLAPLAPPDLAPIIAEAMARWNATGLTEAQRAALSAVTFRVADLGGALGLTSGTQVLLDDDGAERGWFVDTTPAGDAEFAVRIAPTELHALGGSPAEGRMDLLTVVLHELGHVLGVAPAGSDHPFDLMAESLATGVRRLPAAPASNGGGTTTGPSTPTPSPALVGPANVAGSAAPAVYAASDAGVLSSGGTRRVRRPRGARRHPGRPPRLVAAPSRRAHRGR